MTADSSLTMMIWMTVIQGVHTFGAQPQAASTTTDLAGDSLNRHKECPVVRFNHWLPKYRIEALLEQSHIPRPADRLRLMCVFAYLTAFY
jgi:hypothetical protein